MLASLNGLVLVQSLAEFEFARIALVSTLLVSILCGFLSPVVVLKQRAYIGDTLTHLVFPGVIAGFFAARRWDLPLWGSLLVGAAVSGLVGNMLTALIEKRLRIPPDAAAVVTLTGFFGLGVLSLSQVSGTRVDLHRILFGDVLTLEWTDAVVLTVVLVLVAGALLALRAHWDSWLSDPEFGALVGFRMRVIERTFPVLVTLVVLTGMFTVGGLMISALLALPAILVQPHSSVSWRAVLVSTMAGLVGTGLAFQFDWPVGSTIVVLGLAAVLAKSAVTRV